MYWIWRVFFYSVKLIVLEQYWRFWWWSVLFSRRILVLKTLRRLKANPNPSRLRTVWVTRPAPLRNPRLRSAHSRSPQVRAPHSLHYIISTDAERKPIHTPLIQTCSPHHWWVLLDMHESYLMSFYPIMIQAHPNQRWRLKIWFRASSLVSNRLINRPNACLRDLVQTIKDAVTSTFRITCHGLFILAFYFDIINSNYIVLLLSCTFLY